MGLMDIMAGFRGAATTPSPTANPTEPMANGNPTVPNNTTIDQGGTQTVGAIPAPAQGDKSPLADYKDLWQIDDKAAAKLSMTPEITIDNAKIMEAARTMDFTKGLDPALLDKASKGDAKSFADVINAMQQNGYAQTAALTLNVVKAALTQQEDTFRNKVMPDILRRNNISNELRGDNTLYDNPAIAPVLQNLEQQFVAKYPNASPNEIKEHAKSYFTGLATEIVKSSGGKVDFSTDTNNSNNPNRVEPDWEKLLIS